MGKAVVERDVMSESCEAEFYDVYDEALPCVYGFLVRRTDDSTAEDLTQEVFVTAARTWGAGDGARVTVPWLLTVARSRLIDHYRAEQRRHRNLQAAWSTRPRRVAASAEESSEAARLAPATEAALASLPGPQRAALVLHHLDDLSVAKVAETLARSVPATESLLARARRSFHTALAESDR
jgi:RNA polymerase sigma-70 factor (ECF subfamily)